MTNAKAIEVIRENCYVFNPMNLDRTTLVNTALDTAIKAIPTYFFANAIFRTLR
jgi:hypothetical protein